MALSDIELRVLGSLVEKERTTPEGYPLSTQALVTACNQKTSRDPVSNHHLQDVMEAVSRLRDKGLAATIQEVADRVPKHRHLLARAWSLNDAELALISVLMLRGPQTPGELRTRTERYTTFADLSAVEATLRRLAERNVPMVENLGRGPGQSQDRWMHKLGADEQRLQPRVRGAASEAASAETDSAKPSESVMALMLRRLEELERRVSELEQRLD